MSLLSVENLYCGYDGQPVVRDLSLSVERGELVALLGPNGAGKTTTLATIAGLVSPISGKIELDGESITGRRSNQLARSGVALVPEDRSLFPSLTVRDNMRVARRRGGATDAEILEILPELEKCLRRTVGVLSGGEQQMLAVGRALLLKPKLLLVDEMSLGLAPVIVERLLPVLRRVADEMDAGVLFVEQHVPLALKVADRAIVISQGVLRMNRPAEELRGRRDLIAASYLGEAAPVTVE
jgi:branched-chain amino acid transport system ATP-binding protein